MKKLRHQTGFSSVEAIVAFVIVAALVGVGVWVMNRQSDKSEEKADTSQTTEAPAVNDTSDLEAAEKALEDSDLDAGSSDNEELNQELQEF